MSEQKSVWHLKEIILRILKDIMTCRPIAKERLVKQVRNKYATNNRVDPLLGNARNAHT
jgi:hypothetical protein